jgi:hypothetical protein
MFLLLSPPLRCKQHGADATLPPAEELLGRAWNTGMEFDEEV